MQLTPSQSVPLSPRRARRRRRGVASALGLLVLLVVLGAAGCSGIVVQPIDQSTANGPVAFWGYSLNPGEQVRLEAQSTTWELLATTTSATVPTHVGGNAGYFYQINYSATAIPTRFRKTSPYTGYWRSSFRLTTASGTLQTRQWQTNSNQSSLESWLSRFWFTHTASGSPLRIDIRP